MSGSTTLQTGHASTPDADAASSPPRRVLRVWPAVILIAAFWAALYANHNLETWMLPRFLSRLAAYGILLIGFLAWWLTRSAVSWRDRLLSVAVVICLGAAAIALADKSNKPFLFSMNVLPFVITVSTAWLIVSRSFTPTVRRVGFCVALLLTFTYFDLLRYDGVDAAQRGENSWRWTSSNEDIFLASQVSTAKAMTEKDAAPKAWTPLPGDCLEYRGPNRDGTVSGVSINTDWKEQPPRLLWREKVGPGWAGLIVVDGHLVTQEQRGDLEAVVCYDATTGKEIWAHTDPVRFEESLAGAGPRSTPTFADGRIYSMGAKATLNCLNPQNGTVIWSHDVMADAGVPPADMPQWGYSVSPLVVDGLVIVFGGGAQEKSVLAY